MAKRSNLTEPDIEVNLSTEFRNLIDGIHNHGLKGKEYWFKYLSENGDNIFKEVSYKLDVFDEYEKAIEKLESLSYALKDAEVLLLESKGIDIAIKHFKDINERARDRVAMFRLYELEKLASESSSGKLVVGDKVVLDNALDYIYDSATLEDLDDIQEALDTMRKAKKIDAVRGN